MPVPFAIQLFTEGIDWFPSLFNIFKVVVLVAVIALVKWICMGASNTSERKLHGKIVLITGGTSGIGAATALELAQRGAQIVLLVHQSPKDGFLVDYIEDLRERSGNEMIYAEQVDLSSLYSIRKFATKWIDNAPPRRLDMIVLCGSTLTPPGKPRVVTDEGIEENWMINYLANFHLLSILSPAIRTQPPDRDVRIVFTTCAAHTRSPAVDDGSDALKKKGWSSSKAYAQSKYALTVFGHAFSKHLESYKRPDGAPMNARVVFVDPGYCRTPGMRRYLTRGTLWGLSVYLLVYQSIWLFLKSPVGGAQSFLYAAQEASLGRGHGGKLIKECREMEFPRKDVKDEKIAKKLWEGSEKLIERVEREEAVKRALAKKEREEAEKNGKAAEESGKAGSEVKGDKSAKSKRQKKAK
ncbi:NAD(P)-binding Rossmann-fold containing protein [Glarea lozoyensis ATCC 20868]|uniref:NAD(P)-binding Rossmann-fold containing protein n=1 Tax=Glarea lozoyensis (strain ATCC 20868 / MF5171) TaxID=1116229 RepID=S3DBB6_GLAL2|nr:NAD(P)-binding Rossmann-fold containing protein [Glarea lozoyensis ATCC 20868]EPE35747.1 NAD(P)-binding Rossmann-fold containing protein [Glarea lozoyensis ATCC 20868]